MKISSGRKDDVGVCLHIAASLSKYFTPEALEAIRNDLAGNEFHVARDDAGLPVGFVLIKRTSELTAELAWLAVDAAHHRHGVGTALVDACCASLRTRGVRLILVRTLAKSACYPPYEVSRSFLEKLGFIHIDTIDPYPGWAPGNPCALYARPL